MVIRYFFALTLLFSVFVSQRCFGQSIAADSGYHPILNPSLAVHRREGEIALDGDVTDAGWRNAAHTTTFTSSTPRPLERPPVQTDAYITYDDDYLYVAMVAHDPHPENIRSTMIGRDLALRG